MKNLCYVNSDDPRVFVRDKEQGGITLNFAHPISYVIIVCCSGGYVAGGVYFGTIWGAGWAGVFTLAYSVALGITFFIFYKIDARLHQGRTRKI